MNPSLLLIPDRYKASKLYSQIPDSGAGDLAFTRANDTATRVNSAGLIEKVRTNTILYSEQFNDAYWGKFQATITANSTTAPDGTLTADTITDDANNGSHVIFKTGAWNTTSQTFSIFAKAGTSSKVYIFNNTLGTGVFADLSANTIIVDSGFVGTLTAVGNGWFRITAAHTAGGAQSIAVGLFIGTSTSEYVGTGSTAFLWGAQLEAGDIATPYIPTTTAAVSVGPIANIPRIDYTGGGCGKLLLEPQRTNLYTSSEDLNSLGIKVNVTVSSNISISPDGYVNADKLEETSASGNHFIYGSKFSVTSGTTYTMSFFAKQGERRYLVFQGDGQAGLLGNASVYDLQAGTVYFNANTTNTITPYGNGWYRITVTTTASGTSTAYPFVAINQSAGNSLQSYAGTAGNGFFIYGFQAEVGSYATSYIPTLGASVTRSADSASKTGISSLIGQTEGTLFCELEVIDGTTNIGIWLRQSGSLYDNIIVLSVTPSRTPRMEVINGGAGQVEIIGAAISTGFHKIAFAYKANDFAVYVDGVQAGADTSGTIPTCNEIYIDQYIDGGARNATKKSAVLYSTRLTNSELASLTSL
jgi:hypothetical protein